MHVKDCAPPQTAPAPHHPSAQGLNPQWRRGRFMAISWLQTYVSEEKSYFYPFQTSGSRKKLVYWKHQIGLLCAALPQGQALGTLAAQQGVAAHAKCHILRAGDLTAALDYEVLATAGLLPAHAIKFFRSHDRILESQNGLWVRRDL